MTGSTNPSEPSTSSKCTPIIYHQVTTDNNIQEQLDNPMAYAQSLPSHLTPLLCSCSYRSTITREHRAPRRRGLRPGNRRGVAPVAHREMQTVRFIGERLSAIFSEVQQRVLRFQLARLGHHAVKVRQRFQLKPEVGDRPLALRELPCSAGDLLLLR